MASAGDSFGRWTRENPLLPVIGLCALVTLGASGWVGIQSQKARQQLGTTINTWKQASQELATVRQQFRMPSTTESDAILKESASLGQLGVPAGERVSIMELVSRLAEASDLRGVRVSFQAPLPADSGFVPPRSIGSKSITQAGYTISLDFTGSFAGLMQFVSSLPPSLSVTRLGAARQGDGATYRVLLAVYEFSNGNGAN
jgi:hypothetical protein